MNGTLEFIDSADMSSMTSAEHYLATDVEWDPTGRYVVTSVSYWGHKMENAYWIWNFQGKLVLKQVMDKFCQFSWRPRPQSLLNKAAIKVRILLSVILVLNSWLFFHLNCKFIFVILGGEGEFEIALSSI